MRRTLKICLLYLSMEMTSPPAPQWDAGEVAARAYMLHALGRELQAAGRLAAPPG